MTWSPAVAAHEPPGPMDLATVPNALVTAFEHGPLRVDTRPRRWVRGAVHDGDGVLVPASQRLWNGEPHSPAAADPEVVTLPDGVRRLDGTWLYAGHWAGHFGHFLLELLPTLWPDPTGLPPLAGVLLHRSVRGPVPPVGDRRPLQTPTLLPWQAELVTLAGHDPASLRIVHGRALRVEELVVPERPVLLKRWAAPEAAALWRRVSEAVGDRGDQRRVYLSRTRFHAVEDRSRTDGDDDARLDTAFAAAGFAVVHPETLTVREQVALVRGAEVLAGLAGSALHLSAFAFPGTRVLCVGDERTPTRPPHSQVLVDAALGHETAFVPHGDPTALDDLLDTL